MKCDTLQFNAVNMKEWNEIEYICVFPVCLYILRILFVVGHLEYFDLRFMYFAAKQRLDANKKEEKQSHFFFYW